MKTIFIVLQTNEDVTSNVVGAYTEYNQAEYVRKLCENKYTQEYSIETVELNKVYQIE